MEYKVFNDKIILKISRGDDVLDSLALVTKLEKITFATFEAIGAIEEVSLGYLKEDGKYLIKEFNGDWELVSLKGSVAGNEEIHAHAIISGSDFIAKGGHFFGGVVSGVVEMVITNITNEKIEKVQKEEDLFPTWNLEK